MSLANEPGKLTRKSLFDKQGGPYASYDGWSGVGHLKEGEPPNRPLLQQYTNKGPPRQQLYLLTEAGEAVAGRCRPCGIVRGAFACS